MELRKTENEVNDAVAIYQSIASTKITGIESNRMDTWEELLSHDDIVVEDDSEIKIPHDEVTPKDFLIQLETFRDRIISLSGVTTKFKERSEMVRSCDKNLTTCLILSFPLQSFQL